MSCQRRTRKVRDRRYLISRDVIHAAFRRGDAISAHVASQHDMSNIETLPSSGMKVDAPAVEFARCFLRLANLPNFALDRLSRYEATLWRQAGRILFALDALGRRKPQERGCRFRDRSEFTETPV
jgi:hypothetical protein